MPDNTWYTPYILPLEDCLSSAAFQGVAYKLSEDFVLKMPYQYPVQDLESFDNDEGVEQLELSQSSIDSFKVERTFYQSLANARQQYIVKADVSTLQYGIILEHLQPLEQAWYASSVRPSHRWIRQFLRANTQLEMLGYTHGDLGIRNMGVDKNGDLKLFDFGSVHRHSDEGFPRGIERDLSRFATCLHFLLSGKDPLANIKDLQSLRQIQSALKSGTFEVDVSALPAQDILNICWAEDLSVMEPVHPTMVFRHVERLVLRALNIPDSDCYMHEASLHQSSTGPDERSGSQLGELVCLVPNRDGNPVVPDPRWMPEEQYDEAWRVKGVTT